MAGLTKEQQGGQCGWNKVGEVDEFSEGMGRSSLCSEWGGSSCGILSRGARGIVRRGQTPGRFRR